VDFIRQFDCINCIKMFGSGFRPPGQSREGREERRIDGGREVASCMVLTPRMAKVYDRSQTALHSLDFFRITLYNFFCIICIFCISILLSIFYCAAMFGEIKFI